MLRSLNIAIGNFFFRRRNFVFPCVFLLTACTTTPEIFLGSQTLDLLFVGSGAVEAILGQTVRFVTIGFQYIHRGGKKGKVYANHLVSGGMYNVVRNPMYVGNALIAIGMAKYMGHPEQYLSLFPFFCLSTSRSFLPKKNICEINSALNMTSTAPASIASFHRSETSASPSPVCSLTGK